jgi:iron(III) transport system substrate-binding protein
MAAAALVPALPFPAIAQGKPSWLDNALLAKAKAEGGKLVIYSSVNEQEALAFWKGFEEASGIAIEYVRSSDTGLIARTAIEARAQQRSWDIIVSTAVSRVPKDFMAPIEAPLLRELQPGLVDDSGRTVGVSANYNMPAFNTKLVKPEELPRSYPDFAKLTSWAGRAAIDIGDMQWLAGMSAHYGEDNARKMLGEIVAALKPVLTDGHLALARQVGSGEYAISINNYVNLTNNVKMAGNPIDYWVLEPVVVFYARAGVSVRAPHPSTAQLAVNFLISKEGQTLLTAQGRVPARRDVEPNPPDLNARIGNAKVVPVSLDGEQEKKWTKLFSEIFKDRR